MIRKHLGFMKLSGITGAFSNMNSMDRKKRVIVCAGTSIISFFGFILQGFLGFKVNVWFFTFAFMLYWNIAFFYKGISVQAKGIPVKDSFVVKNVLFVYPMFFSVFITVVVGGIIAGLSLLSLLMSKIVFDDNILVEFENFLIYYIRNIDPLSIVFSVSIAAGISFLISMQSFYKNNFRRTIGYVFIVSILLIGIVAFSTIMKDAGVSSDFYFSEIIYVLPRIPCTVCAVTFAFVSGIYAWKRSMYLYRHDIKGQEKMNLQSHNYDYSNDTNRIIYSGEVRKARIVAAALAVAGILFVIGMMIVMLKWVIIGDLGLGTSNAKNGELNVETDRPSEYTEWTKYLEREGVPEEAEFMCFDLERTLIFPEHIDEAYITEYYAKLKGKYSYEIYENDDEETDDLLGASGSWNVESARFLVADYPAEEFEKECDRLAKLSYSEYEEDYADDYEGDIPINYMLVDDDDFPGRTYIALYDIAMARYEYAITDEDSGRIIYVFLNECIDIPTDTPYKAKAFSKVVPITKRNSGSGYSIYGVH